MIRRNPDIKLNRLASDIEPLNDLQANLLNQLWQCLKPDGILVYATCSLLPSENEEQVSAFISRHDDAELIAIESNWGVNRNGCRQLFPQLNGHDGFFYGKIRKKL